MCTKANLNNCLVYTTEGCTSCINIGYFVYPINVSDNSGVCIKLVSDCL
jgi:hypothetical protein